MRALLLILLLAFSTSYGQTKEELINAIIKVNSLDGWDGIMERAFPGQIENNTEKTNVSSNNYYNFKKLKEIISKEDLVKLTNHENQVLRLYAIRELIEQNDKSINLNDIILEEINNQNYIQTHEGCIISQELSYSIIYHDYWNQVRINALENFNEDDEYKKEQIMLEAQENDSLLKSINSEIIKLDKDIYWLIYARIFEIRNYGKDTKSNIIELLFKHNNSFAFEYLKNNYPNEFKKISKKYFENYFENQNFETENQAFYLFYYTNYAFENDNQEIKEKVLNRLKKTKGWKRISGTFEMQIFRKYNIKI